MRPGQLHASEVLDAIGGVLPSPPASVLEVGCGRGFLSAALLAAGYAVTAIDPDPDAVTAARELGVSAWEQELAEHDATGYAAVICSRSVHHIPDLTGLAEQLARLLADDGVLVVDEFDRAAVDAPTAAWFYGTRSLLSAAGLTTVDDEPGECQDPLERWQQEHATDPPLHTGAAIQHALHGWFASRQVYRGDGLWVYLCQGLADSDHAGKVAATLRDLEGSLLANQVILPVGLRLSAQCQPPVS